MGSAPSPLHPPADFGSRFSAFMIDAALLFVMQWVIVAVLSRQLQAVGMTSQETCAFDIERICEGPSNGLGVLFVLVLIGSTLGYHAVFEGRWGATPGKRWMGLRVIGTEGLMPIGLARATARSLGRQAFWIVLFVVFGVSQLGRSVPTPVFLILPTLAFAVVASAAFAADGRGAHDYIANTIVVHDPGPEGQLRPRAASLFEGALWDETDQDEDEDPSIADDHAADMDREESR